MTPLSARFGCCDTPLVVLRGTASSGDSILLARVERFDGELARIGVALEALAVDRRGAMVRGDVKEVYQLLGTCLKDNNASCSPKALSI